mgnify:FL=1
MVPILTKEQRQANLAKGMEIRQRRAYYREQLKTGALTVEKLFGLADEGDQAAAGMRVKAMIAALPGYAETRAEKLMKSLRIASSRKVKGLGKNQRANLLSTLVRW